MSSLWLAHNANRILFYFILFCSIHSKKWLTFLVHVNALEGEWSEKKVFMGTLQAYMNAPYAGKCVNSIYLHRPQNYTLKKAQHSCRYSFFPFRFEGDQIELMTIQWFYKLCLCTVAHTYCWTDHHIKFQYDTFMLILTTSSNAFVKIGIFYFQESSISYILLFACILRGILKTWLLLNDLRNVKSIE